MFISLIGTWIQAIAQSWLIFQLTHSAFLLGFVGFLTSIPVFFLALFGGVLADRLNKRNILIATQIIFMLLTFLFAILTQTKIITPFLIMIFAVLDGIVMAFDAPSRQAVVVELVGREHLMNAISLNSVAFNSSRIIGPALAGILIALVGMSGCFYINGISFLAMIIALFLIKLNNNNNNNNNNSNSNNNNSVVKNNHAIKDIKDGLSFVKNNRLIMALITTVGVVSLFGVSYAILMPIFANDILHVGVKGLALLMSCSGFGALLAALLLARLGDFNYKGKFLILSSLVFSVSLILFSLSKVYIFSLIALMFVGGSSVSAIALINTLLQSKVPDAFRGRVMGVFMLTFAGIMPFGNLISGWLAHALGVCTTVMISGIICFVFFIIINIIYPEIKNI